MGFAVCHIEKVTTGATNLGAHIDRVVGHEYSFHNSDPGRRDQNVDYQCGDFNKVNLNEAIKQRIETGYTGKTAIRKDAVRAMSIVLTGSPEQMTEIFSKAETRQAWVKANMNFIGKEFGLENVVRFTLHMDEKTPHIHAVVVPITKKGSLSAKEVMGDKIAMSKRQTRYGQEMEPFGLQRGVVGSKAVHNSEGWYLGQQKKEQEAVLGALPELSLLDRINPSKFLDSVSNQLILVSNQAVQAKLEAKRKENQLRAQEANLKRTSDALEKSRKELLQVKSELQETKKDLQILGLKGAGLLKPEFEKKAEEMSQKFVVQMKERIEQEKNKAQGINFNNLDQNKGRGMSR